MVKHIRRYGASVICLGRDRSASPRFPTAALTESVLTQDIVYLRLVDLVAMYAIIKGVEIPKITIAHIWLRKERWLKNLAGDEDENSV